MSLMTDMLRQSIANSGVSVRVGDSRNLEPSKDEGTRSDDDNAWKYISVGDFSGLNDYTDREYDYRKIPFWGQFFGHAADAATDGIASLAQFAGFEKAGDFLHNEAQRGEAQLPSYTKPSLSLDYITDPNGLTSAAGMVTGSMLSIAPIAALVPESAVAGAVTAASKVPKIGGPLSRFVGNAIRWAPTGPVEAAMEGGAVEREMLENGASREDANRAAWDVFKGNAALLTATNAVEGGLLGKLVHKAPTFSNPIANTFSKIFNYVPQTAAEMAVQGYEEGAQEGISRAAMGQGEDSFSQILNPVDWTDEQWDAAKMGAAGSFPLVGGTAMMRHLQGALSSADDNAPTLTSGNAEIDAAINAAAAKHGLPADLLFAVAQTESDFDQSSVSSTGAKGIMQLMPDTAAALGVDADDMVQNIEGGARYLKQQLDDFGGNVEMALAAYNAGPDAVQKHKGVPPYTETQNYVAKIMGILDGANMNPATEAEAVRSLLDDAEPFIGTRMDNGTEGCVEAVTKIGAAGSDFLRAELEAGVVNVDRLVEDAGDRVIPFDASSLEEGDVIVYGDKNDAQRHVVLYDGKGGYIGNSSSQNLVVHASDYNAMESYYPTKIIKSGGRYGGTVNISSVSGSVRPIDYSGLVVDAKNLQANAAAMKALIEGDKLTPAQKAAIIDAAEIIRDTPTEASTASPGEDALDYNAWQRLIDHKDIKGIFAKDPERVTRMVMRGEETQRKAQTAAAIENQQKVAQAQAAQAQAVQATQAQAQAAQAQPAANPAESAARLASVQQELSLPPMAQQEIEARLASYAQTTPHDVERVVIQNGLAHGDFTGIARALPEVYRAAAGRWMQQPQEQAQPQTQPPQPTTMPAQQDMQVPNVQANDVAVPPSQEMTAQMPQQMQGQAQAVPTTEDFADIRQKLAALDAMMQGNPTYVEARRRGDWQTAAQEAAKAGHHDFARFYQMLHEKATGAPINITPYQNPAEKAVAEQGAVRPTPAPVPINPVDSMRPIDIPKSYGARRDFGRGLIKAMRMRNLPDVRALNDDLRDGEKRAIEHALKRIAQADEENVLLRGETAAQRANDNETVQAESRKKQDDDVQVESAQNAGEENSDGHMAWIAAHPFHYDDAKSMEENIRDAEALAQEYLDAFGTTDQINTPERQELRRKIADKLYGEGAAKKEGKVWLVLGVPASGKSTFADPLVEREGALLIDSDEAKKLLPEFSNGLLAGAVHEESAKIADTIFSMAMANNDNMILPLVGKTLTSLQKKIDTLKKAGYEVNLIYVDLPIEKAIERTKARFRETGRLVSPSYLGKVGLKPKENYDKLKRTEEVDSYEAWNSDVERGSHPRLVEHSIRSEQETSAHRMGGRGQHARPLDESGGLRDSSEESRRSTLNTANRSDNQGGFSTPKKSVQAKSAQKQGKEKTANEGGVVVTGKEFGEYRDIKELRKKALQYYKEYLQGTSVENALLGKIDIDDIGLAEFTGSGKRELKNSSAKEEKLLLVKHLPALIHNATDISGKKSSKESHAGEYFYYLHTAAEIQGVKTPVEITLIKRNNRTIQYYNHTLPSLEKGKKIESASVSTEPESLNGPSETPSIHALSSVSNIPSEQEKSKGKSVQAKSAPLTKQEQEALTGTSEEAKEAYCIVRDKLAKSKNKAVVRAAKVGATLFARHADIYAKAYSKATGKPYTALDYMRDRFGLDVDGTEVEANADGLKQSAPNRENLSDAERKDLQFRIIQEMNPMRDDIHTGVRSPEDILVAKEAFQSKTDEDSYAYPDFTKADGIAALKRGSVTVYSSHPILPGAFVTPSRMQAKDYAGGGNVYSARVPIEDVAWLHSDEGQYAPLEWNGFDQSAWHGTPHKFKKFDLGAIGTGEGAQVHGWGLYFAQQKSVGEGYRERLTGGKWRVSHGDEVYEFDYDTGDLIHEGTGSVMSHDDPETLAIEAFIGSNANKYGALNILENALEDKRRMFFPGEALDEEVGRIEDAIELLENEWSRFDVEPSGSLFQVEIPDNDVLLDEQLSFDKQPEKVQEALKRIADEMRSTEEGSPEAEFAENYRKMNGKKIYEALTHITSDYEDASRLLNNHGIKGITYDGQRDGRCFVIFDDEAIEIIEKFNQRMNSIRKGSITPQASGRRIISLFEQADESTFLHEMGHMFLMDLEDLAAIDAASAEDLETVRDWATWQEGQAKEYEDTPWQKEFAEREKAILAAKKRGDVVEVKKLRREWEQERFARGFERYLETGKAPTSVLKRIFLKFKKFLQSIYQAFKGTGGKASPEVEAVMGRMIAEEQGASSEFEENPVQTKSAPIQADFSASKLKGATGRDANIVTDSGEEIPVRYRLVEALSLVTSNSAKDFSKNPAYPKSLQPRDRERANMQQQIREMASRLRPEDLAASRSVNLGAPVVRADGVVLNGNGRAIAITRALLGNTFRDSTGKGYRAFLVEHAEEFGFKPETVQRMKAPMLVREVTGGLNAEQVKAVTTSTAGGSRLGASEQAKQDAEKITLEDLARYEENERGDLTTAANRDFVAGILYRVAGKNDVNAYTDAKGQVNADGIQRVKRALFQKAYGDDDLLSRMSESTNDDTRNITNGLTIAAPYIARANEKMARGTAHNYKLGETIADAVKRYNHLHGIGQSVENYLDQQAMFAEYEDSPEVREVLRVLNENRRSGKRIAQFVRRVGEIVEAQGNPNEISLMEGGEPLSLRDIIEIARRKFAEEEASRTALVHEAETLYQQAAERFPGIQDKEVASHVREAIQTTLDFGSLDGEIRAVAGNIYQDANGTTFSLFGNGGGTRSAVRNPSARGIQRQEIKAQKRGKIYGLGITRALVNDGAVSLVGQKAKSPAALAEIAQVLRHPGYEKFHIVYIKANGAVVYHETVSARLPHRSVINAPEDKKGAVTSKDVLQNMHKRIEANLRKTGADKFYYIHNHPSGNPKPSAEDIQVTKQILDIKNRTNERAFAGHVVLDHNKYAVIDESLRVGEFRLKNKTPMTFEAPEKTHPALGITISHPNDTSRIAEMCAADAETVAFHLTPQLVVRGVQKIHDDFKKKSWDKQMRYLRHCARITGGTHIVLATSNRMLFEFGKADINNGRESGILDIVFMQDRRAIETGNNVGGSVMDRQNWFGLDMDDVESQRLLEPTRQYGVSLDTLFQFSRDNSKPGSTGRFRRLLVGLKIGEAAEKNLEVHRSNKEKQLVIAASKLNQFMADKSLTEKNVLKTEDLGGGKIRVTYMPQDFHNIHILDWLKSVRQLRKKNPFVKAIYDLGSHAMRLQEHLRNEGAKTVKEFRELTKNKNDRKLVTSILLEGDAAGKEYGVQELRAMGANANVIKAYQLVRRTMREWYKRVNDARMQVRTRTKTLSKNDLADFKKNHWIQDSDVLSVEEKGDGKVLLTWRGIKTYETLDRIMTKEELDALLQDKDINVTHFHKLGESYGVNNYSVDYVERIKPLGNLTGYMPHFFHEWMVYEKHKDPKTGEVRLTTIGSGRSMNDAVRLGNEIARKNSDKEYVVRPKGFDLKVENSVVIGDVDFQQMAAKLAENTEMTLSDANAFLRDNAGATIRARHRFFGNAMYRTGAKGFDTDITYVLTHYLNTSARYIAMEQFKPRAISLYERWFGAFDADPKDATVSYVKGLIKDINGDPRQGEKYASELIMATPFGKMISDAYGDRTALALNAEVSTWNAISKLGLGNFASMAVNFSQFINIGAAMNDYGYAAKGFWSALHPTTADVKILEESGVLDEINQAADNGGYTQRRFGRVGSVYGAIKRVGELSLLPFQYADVLMRKTAILGAYKQGVEQLGLTHEEAMERARDINYDANFDYSSANAPLMIRWGSVWTQQLSQFQKYPIMQMEFMYNILFHGTRGQKVRFFLPYVLLCGLPGMIPFGEIFNQIFSFLFWAATGDDKDIGDEIKAEALRWAGKDPAKKFIVNWAIYGVLAPTFGIDVSKRIGISGAFSGEFFGAQKPESVGGMLAMQLGGPAVSTAVNMQHQLHNGNPIEALKAFSPALGNMAQAMVGVSRTTRHRVKSRYETTYDRIIHAMGFRSVDESNNSFITSYEFDRKDAETHAKQEAIMDYLDDPNEANRQRINALGIKDKAIEEARIQQERSATERAKGGKPKVESGKTSKRRTSHKRKEEKPKKETLFDTIDEEDEGM